MVDDVHAAGVTLAKEADARRGELERERQVPKDLFQRAGDAGLFRQLLCAELGGLGRSPAEWFQTSVDMARWEPSFAWVVAQGAGDVATFVAVGNSAFTSAFLADQRAYLAGSDHTAGTLVPEGDGFLFAGRWGFCSGCQGATWVGGKGVLPQEDGGGPPEWRYALVPIERARIEETWDVMGMIGTGSHTVVVEQQHIPDAWTFNIRRPGAKDYGPMSVMVGNGYWPVATAVAAIQLGISRRALDAAAELVKVKPGVMRTRPLIENAHVQRQLMQVEGTWIASHAGVEQALTRMWREAEQSRRLPIETRLALFTANAHASATATKIVESVCDMVGTSVAPARGIFGACLKDARTIGSHAAVSGPGLEMAAQLRFGLVEDGFWV